ncbi:DNA primase [Aquipluma nitroreducens]|uniref:DNA primase n=1 Tax=Aquipluma nitroreducens TaxID=2010828 RepID=A0A5K7S937_9BACT|nr:DNA primase [Aquipluma nitroreducens]BBE18046.1 DNA primase [Aquipluma nitroreducens]
MIDQATIERIVDAAHISDVVSEFVTLKKRGVNQLGLCPFHNEKTPSFTVSPAKGIFKCFGCGKGGNSVNFIMELEQLSYPDALRWLAKKFHIEIEEKEESLEEKALKDERESMMIASAFAQKYFSRFLLNENEGRTIGLSYLRERGIRDDIITKFELGYCPDGKDLFTQAATREGYKMEFLEKTGLTIKRDDWVRDRFGGRVIFPVHNVAGRVIAFGGRTLTNDKKVAKYLNSPESDIYHKGRTLYGIYQAKRDITRLDKCYLVEGYTDVLSFHQAGIENVVASSGTSLTIDQIRLIRRFSPNITIVYDGDDAGIKASLRGIDMVLEEGINVKVLPLPRGEDPDSFARSMSASELAEYIKKNETDFIKFKTQLLMESVENDPVSKARLINEIVHSISVIPDTITRTIYIKECSRLMDVQEAVLYSEIRKIQNKQSEDHTRKELQEIQVQASKPRVPATEKTVVNPFETEEREILRILLKYFHQEVFEIEDETTHETHIYTVGVYVLSELQNDGLISVNERVRDILLAMEENVDNKDFDPIKYFTQHPNNEISQYASNLLAEKYIESKRWSKGGAFIETESELLHELVPILIKEYKIKNVKLMQKNIWLQIDEAFKKRDDEKVAELQTQYQKLNEVVAALSKMHGFRAIT